MGFGRTCQKLRKEFKAYWCKWTVSTVFLRWILRLLKNVDTKRRELLKWLSSVDYNAHHEKTRSLRFENTGSWMFGKTDFVNWIETDMSSIMWIYGKGVYLVRTPGLA